METPRLLPMAMRELGLLGERIKLARLRRRLTCKQVSERAGITTLCLLQVEEGSPSLSLGIYLSVLRVLGLEKDIYRIAEDDVLGRKLQDIELLSKV